MQQVDENLDFHLKQLKHANFLTRESKKYQVGIEYLSLANDTIRFLKDIEFIEPHRTLWHKGIGYFGIGFPKEKSRNKLQRTLDKIDSQMKALWERQMLSQDKFFPEIVVIHIPTLLISSNLKKRNKRLVAKNRF